MTRHSLLLAIILSSCSPSACLDQRAQPHDETLFGAPVSASLGRDERAKWLRDALVSDNRDLFERSPALTAGKLRKMASSPYNYFRGTASIYWSDMTQPGVARYPTAFGGAGASHVLLLGDPHPENIGTFFSRDGELLVEYNDFDGSSFGPYHLDLWRLAVGFEVMAATLGPPLERAQRDELLIALATSYYDAVQGQPQASLVYALGDPTDDAGSILADLLGRAERMVLLAVSLMSMRPFRVASA